MRGWAGACAFSLTLSCNYWNWCLRGCSKSLGSAGNKDTGAVKPLGCKIKGNQPSTSCLLLRETAEILIKREQRLTTVFSPFHWWREPPPPPPPHTHTQSHQLVLAAHYFHNFMRQEGFSPRLHTRRLWRRRGRSSPSSCPWISDSLLIAIDGRATPEREAGAPLIPPSISEITACFWWHQIRRSLLSS